MVWVPMPINPQGQKHGAVLCVEGRSRGRNGAEGEPRGQIVESQSPRQTATKRENTPGSTLVEKRGELSMVTGVPGSPTSARVQVTAGGGIGKKGTAQPAAKRRKTY